MKIIALWIYIEFNELTQLQALMNSEDDWNIHLTCAIIE